MKEVKRIYFNNGSVYPTFELEDREVLHPYRYNALTGSEMMWMTKERAEVTRKFIKNNNKKWWKLW